MKKLLISAAIISAIALSGCDVKKEKAVTPVDFSNLTEKQKQDLGVFVKDYLIKNPEILISMSNELQKQSETNRIKNIIDLKSDLYSDSTPHIGANDAKVAVVEFFDYNCVFCAKIAPDLEKVIAENKDVRFYFKETPIFASRFPSSISAALAGEYVFKEKGAEAYIKYHNGIYATGHNEGALTLSDINGVLKTVGVEPLATELTAESLQKKDGALTSFVDKVQGNLELSKKADLRGTPYILIMPVNNPTVENIRIIDGYQDYEKINKTLQEVKANTQ